MQDINFPPFFESLHRPYHQPLKTARWACEYISTRKMEVKSSSLNLGFYTYLIKKLHISYSKNEIEDYQGLISKFAVDSVYENLKSLSTVDKKVRILEILRNERTEDIDRQIYSTYKAASYYMNLAKDKLNLISANNNLTEHGKILLSLPSKSNVIALSFKERDFFFERLVENDFLLLVPLCLCKGLEYKYKLTYIDNTYFDFVNKIYNVKHFLYNNQSLPNYNKVRGFWIDTLRILDKRNKIKKHYIEIIEQSPTLQKWFEEISLNFKKYENDNFRNNRSYEAIADKFTAGYKECLVNNKDILGFVNIYDIKDEMRISHDKFEIFLNQFYEKEKAKSHIFFSNIVSSIDRRKRFVVRGASVLKIKIRNSK